MLTSSDFVRQQEGRSADILAVRAALKVGKTFTLQDAKAQREARELKELEDRKRMPPPPAIPRPRESKAGNLPRERPAVGQSQKDGSDGFGSQFQQMKKTVHRAEGESRKAYKKRVHASMRSVKKGGKPIAQTYGPAAFKRDADAAGIVKDEASAATAKAEPAAKAKAGRTTDTRRVMLRMEPARGPGGFAAKVALKSREKAEEQRRARLWDSLDDGVPEREAEVYPW